MAKHDELKQLEDQIKIENARVGYQVATNLWVNVGETLWSQFNAFLVANSIVIASIVLSMTVLRRLAVFLIVMPVFGMILCFCWFLVIKRSFDYFNYYIKSSREIEEQYLSEPIQTISRGEKFAHSKEGAAIMIGGIKERSRMSCWGRLLPVRHVSYIIIVLFFLIYVAILITNSLN